MEFIAKSIKVIFGKNWLKWTVRLKLTRFIIPYLKDHDRDGQIKLEELRYRDDQTKDYDTESDSESDSAMSNAGSDTDHNE